MIAVNSKNQKSVYEGVLESVANLPCLFSNNSTESEEKKEVFDLEIEQKIGKITFKVLDTETGEITTESAKGKCNLSISQKKSAIALAWNIEYMAKKYGLENLGFLTLTFPKKITLMSEAQRHFNSLNNHFLRKHYLAHVAVKERCKSGAIHFHLLVVLPFDIRTGFDFEAVSKRDYKSANKNLKKEWSLLRHTVKKYGFGRTELLPVKSSAEGISRYVGKYISKNIQERPDEDKGTRLVNYSGDSRVSNTRYSLAFNNDKTVNKGGANWRHKCRLFAQVKSEYLGVKITHNNIANVLGSRWAYKHRDYILSLPDKDNWIANKVYEEMMEKSMAGEGRKKNILAKLKRKLDEIEGDVYSTGTQEVQEGST